MRHPTTESDRSSPLPIRRGMDVFSAYQSTYLGTVVDVAASGTGSSGGRSGGETSRAHLEGTPELVHEQGATVSPTAGAGSKELGEEMGPFPTIQMGNGGPVKQSAAHNYATNPDHTYEDVAWFAVRPGRINLGPLTPPFYVPVSAIRSISLERIVLDVDHQGIPQSWHTKPAVPQGG